MANLRLEILKELDKNRGDGEYHPLTGFFETFGLSDANDEFQTAIKELLDEKYIKSKIYLGGFKMPVLSGTFTPLGEFSGITINNSNPEYRYLITLLGEKYVYNSK